MRAKHIPNPKELLHFLQVAQLRVITPIKVQEYIDCGADVNMRDSYGNTPLMSVSCSNRSDIAKVLLENGADISLQNAKGWNVLHWAVRGQATNGSAIKIFDFLLENGADANMKNIKGKTALDCTLNRKKICAKNKDKTFEEVFDRIIEILEKVTLPKIDRLNNLTSSEEVYVI